MTHNHLLLIFLLLVVTASGADIVADISEGVNTGHLVQEALVMLFGIIAFCWIALTLIYSKKETARLYREMEEIKSLPKSASTDLEDVKQRLADIITRQFATWSLTPSEQEVGLLLLKGFTLKEIALLRGTAEKTIRQQASSIYKKADLSGRHAFSAWFLEDIL